MTDPFPPRGAGGAEGARYAHPGAAASRCRLAWALLLLASAGLLASSVYRAATFPFTHDESLGFIYSWQAAWRATSNNHLLNTTLMRCCGFLFGDSELSLRLPNVLAHAAYLAGSLLLLKRFQYPALRFTGFVLLNLNPFVLDFFFLARGYGLAMAFLLWSVYWLVCAFDARLHPVCNKYLLLAQSSAALAVLSNYAFLNYYLPLLLVSAWLASRDESLRRFNGRAVRTAIVAFSVHGVFLAIIVVQLLLLRQRDQLYFGGNVGFVSDTVNSLVRASLYHRPYSEETVQAISAILIGLFVAVALMCSYFFVRSGPSLCALFLFLTASAAALPVLQHRLLGTPYPVERAALYYLSLYTATMLSGLHMLAERLSRPWGRAVILATPVVVATFLCFHCVSSFDKRQCYTWHYDAHNYEVLQIIDRDHLQHVRGRAVRLGNSWLFEPSLNYYRITHNYTWLAPVTRTAIGNESADYIYAFEREIETLPKDGCVRLASFPDVETVLFRVNH
jgi:hypothetical protein